MNFLNILLQISTTSVGTDTAATGKVANNSISLLELLMKGGWVMIPIALLSFVAVYIMIERYITIKRASKDTTVLMDKVKGLIVQGDIKGAKLLCGQTDSPIARMIEKGISRLGRPLKDIESSIEATGKLEVYK